ncbi:putative Ubiquinol-cytochrome C reductase hinge protein-domain-containing protein [Seiridium unicorne]|uniref:Ubiquinol-cytochrome C reductase hinge protein-domain-containing protein n=1 Tax=Seiridium unicorne TaxID=138068 RepID=A0ABR2VCJ8_9PEZI
MGFWDTITDLVEAATPWTTAEAEAPAQDEQANDDSKADESEESKDEPKEEEEGGEEESEDAEEEEGEEDEDEEEEEEQDPKDKFEEECKNSKQCAPAKHHYDECVERVTKAEEDGSGAKEDCVEEFFHLAHCATQCAAPKLWSVLK